MFKPNRLLLFAFFNLCLSMTALGCGGNEKPSADNKPPVVRFALPKVQVVTDYEYFTGRTDAVDHVEVRARVTGYLEKINFKAGSEVKEGQLLFQIDARPYQAVLDKAKSQVLLNQASLKLALANFERGKEIAKTKGAVSQEDLDKLAADTDSAKASVQAAKANVESADLNLNFTRVTSPIDGIVGRNLLTTGNLVTQDSTLLTTIVSLDPMYAYFDVDERTMLRIQKLIREGKIKSVKTGTKAPVQFGLANEDDTYPHTGYLDFVNNEVDIATGTIQVRGIIPNPKVGTGESRLLTPGLFVRVRFPVGQPHQSLLVPQAALGTDQGEKFLYVVNDQNVVEYRPVVPGPVQADGWQVMEPVKVVRTKEGVIRAKNGELGVDSLTPTDRVIVGGLQRVRSNMKVDPKPAPEVTK